MYREAAVLHEIPCVAHVHSLFSDGTATVPELAEAARVARAKVVLLTDHDTLAARTHGHERWHDDVLVLVGSELSSTTGHLLTFGLEDEIYSRNLSPPEVVSAVAEQGAFAFAAHPFESRTAFSRSVAPHYPWPLEKTDNVGVELWSLLSDAVHQFKGPRDIVGFMRNPQPRWASIPHDHTEIWDKLCQHRRVPAIGGIDAHQFGVRVGKQLGARLHRSVLTPFPNSRWFSYLQTFVLTEQLLTGNIDADRTAIYDALREGRSYLARPVVASPIGFQFWAQAKNGRRVEIGEERSGGSWQLEVRSPLEAQIELLKDGVTVASEVSDSLSYAVTNAGVFRVEVSLFHSGRSYKWIVTNPIYLRPGD